MERILNVAVATDTILYSPFYLALYGDDFKKTPWGELTINIVGRKGDKRFEFPEGESNIGIDGFVTMCLFFGYADIGICDPSYIIYLLNCTNFADTIKTPLSDFINNLNHKVKDEFYTSNKRYFDVNKNPDYKRIEDDFKEYSIKIIGGLIAKIAFTVVGNEDILHLNSYSDNKFPYIGAPFFGEPVQNFFNNHIDNIISFPNPSTGFCIGEALIRGKTKGAIVASEKKFGQELNYLHSLSKEESKSTVSLTCDYLAIDYIKENRIEGKGLKVLDDYVSNPNNAMFTGIIANVNDEEKNLLYKSFLYAIEKNLFFIKKYLDSESSVSLSDYFRNKLLKNNPRYKEDKKNLISFLVADSRVEKAYTDGDVKDHIENLIFLYVERLLKWKRKGHFLYYSSTKASEEDLKRIYKIRLDSFCLPDNLDQINWNNFRDFRILDDWFEKEKVLIRNKRSTIWKFFTNHTTLFVFTAVFITLEVISIIFKIFHPPIELHGGWGILLWILIGVLAALIFIGAYLNLKIHYMKEFEDFLYKDKIEKKS